MSKVELGGLAQGIQVDIQRSDGNFFLAFNVIAFELKCCVNYQPRRRK